MEVIIVLLMAFSIMDYDNDVKPNIPDCKNPENKELCIKYYSYQSNIDYQNRMNDANALYNLGSVISNSGNIQNNRFQTTCKTRKDYIYGGTITDCN